MCGNALPLSTVPKADTAKFWFPVGAARNREIEWHQSRTLTLNPESNTSPEATK
jgi:hypothetical protein